MSGITPRLDFLPSGQRALWPELSVVREDFVLYGGTALALQVGGRVSVDFDFFSAGPCEPEHLARRFPFLRGAQLIQREPATASFLVKRQADEIKVSFFGALDFGRVGDPVTFTDNGVCAASLLDLAAQKVKVVIQRVEVKDYLDVHTLLTSGVELEAALGAARALYPEFNPAISLKALSYFDDLPKLPENVRHALTSAVSKVRRVAAIPKRSASLHPQG